MIAVALARLALLAVSRSKAKVSYPSTARSAKMVTRTFFCVSPGAKVSVPEVAR